MDIRKPADDGNESDVSCLVRGVSPSFSSPIGHLHLDVLPPLESNEVLVRSTSRDFLDRDCSHVHGREIDKERERQLGDEQP